MSKKTIMIDPTPYATTKWFSGTVEITTDIGDDQEYREDTKEYDISVCISTDENIDSVTIDINWIDEPDNAEEIEEDILKQLQDEQL